MLRNEERLARVKIADVETCSSSAQVSKPIEYNIATDTTKQNCSKCKCEHCHKNAKNVIIERCRHFVLCA